MDDGSVCSELVPLSLEDAVQGKTTSLEIPSVFCAKQGKGKAGGRGVAGKNNALTNADGSKVHIVQTSYNLTQNKIMPTITLHTKNRLASRWTQRPARQTTQPGSASWGG